MTVQTPIELDTPDAEASAQLATSRMIVVSPIAGMAIMLARGMVSDPSVQVDPLVMSLAALAETPDLSLEAVDTCVFDIHQGDDTQLRALRSLRDLSQGRVRFIGATDDVLSLSTARALMEAGIDDVIPLGAQRPELADAAPLAPAAARSIAQRGTPHNGLILSVAQTRGGIGASTFALNLATLLAAKPAAKKRGEQIEPARVALLDLDIQNGTLGARIDVVSTEHYIELLRKRQMPDRSFIESAMVSHESGFDILPAPTEFAPLDAITPAMMATLLDELRLAYDYIVLDLPRAIQDWMEPILARSDSMFLLTDTSVHSVRQAHRMINVFTDDHVSLPIEVVVSLEGKPFRLPAAAKEAEKFLDRKLTTWIPRDDRAALASSDQGKPLAILRPRSAVIKVMNGILPELKAAFASGKRRVA